MRKYIILICLPLLLALTSCNYNSIVEKQQAVEQQWAQVENQYQRRADLIPNLVETVKGYAAHESQTFEKVTEARAGLSRAYNAANDIQNPQADVERYQEAQQNLTRALDIYVNAVHEAYPDLKANTNFQELQAELAGTENRIATERKRYTEVVQEYNTAIKKFPTNIYAGWFGFEPAQQFRAEEGAQKAPKVSF